MATSHRLISRRNVLAAGVLASAGFPSGGAQPAVGRVLRVADFLATIGVNTHLSYGNTPYNDVRAVIGSMRYCGIEYARDWAMSALSGARYGALAEAGIKFCLLCGARRAMADAIEPISAFEAAHPGAVDSLEGPNEIQPKFDYAGLLGNPAAQQYMRDLRTQLAKDPRLRGKATVNFTSYAATSSVADFANQHPYPRAGQQPGALIRLARDRMVGPGAPMAGKPIVFTEFGYHTLVGKPRPGQWQGVDEETQAILLINGWLDAAAGGVARTYIYELFDEDADPPGKSSQERHFGLFRRDRSPKPAAIAIRNLVRRLSNPSAPTRGNSAAPPRVTGQTPVSTLLLRGAQGPAFLLIWAEPPIWNSQTFTRLETPPVLLTLTSPRIAGASAWDILTLEVIPMRPGQSSASLEFRSRPVLVSLD